jgi:hypothetical protein
VKGRHLRDPGPEPIATGLYAVRRSTPQLVTAGDRMRGVPCLACGFPIGGTPAVTVGLTHYLPDRSPAGDLPSTAWLLHAHHGGISTREIHDLTQWRLGTIPAR